MLEHSVFWQCLDTSGCEISRLHSKPSGFEISGTTLFIDNQQKVNIHYQIVCDQSWQTRTVSVIAENNNQKQCLNIMVDQEQRWFLNGDKIKELTGCVDVDLGFTPASNTLPIRRLQLEDGQGRDLEIAWLRFPSLEFVRADQRYQRVTANRYKYFNLDSDFTTELTIDAHGFVSLYPELWEAK